MEEIRTRRRRKRRGGRPGIRGTASHSVPPDEVHCLVLNLGPSRRLRHATTHLRLFLLVNFSLRRRDAGDVQNEEAPLWTAT
jgi:hypothetical protein